MTTDFLIGAVRASDLNPQVKAELEEILYRAEPVKPVKPIVYMEDDWMDAFGLVMMNEAMEEARRRAKEINDSRHGFLTI